MAAAAAAGGEGAQRAAGMVAGSGVEEGGGEEENVLYDLLLNAEWPPETEVQVRWPPCGWGRETGHVSGCEEEEEEEEGGRAQ